MNWPGAFDIYARIKRMNVDCIMENYIYAIKIALKYQRYKLAGLFVWTN